MKKSIIAFALASLISTSWASDASLKQQLEKIGAKNIKISESVLQGFRTAVSDQGVVQISNDGRFIIQGKIFELNNGKVTDISNSVLMPELNALSDEMIVYPAKNQKHVVTIFMDITCQYCQLLHKRIKEYNELGITIRYLAFPRTGLDSQIARQMESIWKSEDKVFALNEAENGRLPKQLSKPNIVKKHYNLGLKFGVTGTPNIVTENGELISGYVEPKDLLAMLDEQY
ncbi:bifunctional protein-disulfide isomerase/oxidoreductase DsbC [Otariodibacter oris]|uniref:Thiol:disulfide interchange protein n=1 Tax=Otariodibacter oris TaxID=1032623 RepID=A0A420XIB9_9PAST|nr:bifunctional protein-disulfide isomerase/oxidoreductase DsbC [Otariodibacter oris]QGM80925.1 bifunctional protein-disulfide isomerase/oxidoreductase DsbC [Otariodibacter oris]RKR76898.1 thiol:disulfide interchange protein DsbC [Otariodibacter oris]